MRLFLGGALAIFMTVGASADDKPEKIDAKTLIGKWEPKAAKRKLVIEFTKDGKIAFSPQGESAVAGTYKVDGNKVTMTIKAEKEQTRTYSISKLTDTEMILKNDKDKEETFSRIKEK